MYNSTKIIRWIENLCLISVCFITMNLLEMRLWLGISIYFYLHYLMNLRHILQEWKLSKIWNTNNALILWIKYFSLIVFQVVHITHFYRPLWKWLESCKVWLTPPSLHILSREFYFSALALHCKHIYIWLQQSINVWWRIEIS